MKLPRRRQFLHLATGAVALPVVSRIAWAQAYPTRPVRIIVGYPAGGSADVVARLIGQQLTERLGQPFVVDNRPGAGTNIATESVVKSAPDGYTLLVVDASPAINTTLYHNLNFFFFRDIAPVACVISVPLFMVVNPAFPAKTILEFIAYAKANPRKVNMASNGNGGLLHLAGELFKMMTGVDLVHVPYRGAQPALTDLISGQVQVRFPTMPASIEYIKTGKVRALAVTTPTRSEVLPDIPPLSEFVPGYDGSNWIGVGAPKTTPPEIIDKLNKEVNAALADPQLKLRLANLGSSVAGGSPQITAGGSRRNREMGQGDPHGQHQARNEVRPKRSGRLSINSVPRSAEPHPRCRSDQIKRRNLIRCDEHRKQSSCALYRSDFRTIQL